jgi:hypothetical protein
MKKVWLLRASLAFTAGPLVAIAGRCASAQPMPRPLLVAVEVAPGIVCDPAAVRRAVEDELKAPVLAPWGAPGAEAPDELVVALDRTRIVMSMRAGADEWTSRTIKAPADPVERLRRVAWLAGNLARDQVSSTLPSPDPEASPREPAGTGSDALPSNDRGPQPSPIEPSALIAASGSSPTESTARRDDSGVASPRAAASWQITASGGVSLTPASGEAVGGSFGIYRPGVAWQVELEHPTAQGSIFGVALDLGPGDTHLLGAAALGGRRTTRGRFLFEATAGAGMELGKVRGTDLTTVDSSMLGTYSTVQSTLQPRLALYARADLTTGVRLSESFDLIARLGGHLTTLGLVQSYFLPSLGLRFRLP